MLKGNLWILTGFCGFLWVLDFPLPSPHVLKKTPFEKDLEVTQ